MNQEEWGLCQLNWSRLDNLQTKNLLLHFQSSTFNWQKFWELVQLNASELYTVYRLQKFGLIEVIPKEISQYCSQLQHQLEMRRSKFLEIIKAFNDKQIKLILLKGSLFAELLYETPFYKRMNDYDILVEKSDITKALQILEKLGFQSVGKLFSKDISNNLHHTPPYLHLQSQSLLGIHWQLVSPRSRYKVDGIFSSIKPFLIERLPAFRMSWEHNLLHVCIHLPFFKTGLRELADVANICATFRKDLDWDEIASLAKAWNAAYPVFRILKLAYALMPWQESFPYQIEKLQAFIKQVHLKEIERRCKNKSVLLQSRSIYIGKIEKSYIVFKLSKNLDVRRKALFKQWHLFWIPPKQEVLKMLGQTKWLYKYRISAPIIIWQAMASDHGHLGLLFLTVYNLYDFAKASFINIFNFSRHDENDLRIKLLETIE